MYIDTHCHLDKENYDNIDQIIRNVEDNIIIVSGVDDKTNKEVLELVSKYPNVYGTIGIHPSEVSKGNSLELIEQNITNPKIVGVGEIGLDYHYGQDDKDIQKEYFINQIKLAVKYNKTIVVHSRDAIMDTYDILKQGTSNIIKIVIHAYSSSVEMAMKFIELGAMLGIGGVVTFKNGVKLKEVVDKIAIENLVLETDSPYLTPEPFRGQKNEPKNVVLIAKEIAKIKNMDESEVLNITTNNALLQFDIHL